MFGDCDGERAKSEGICKIFWPRDLQIIMDSVVLSAYTTIVSIKKKNGAFVIWRRCLD